ncbi:MAG: energy transducer TonB [Hyphomonadaceae bacterium]
MPDKKNDPPEKLSERLEIRLHHSVKQRFLAACRRTGDVPSDVLRAAMKGYIETVEAAEQPSLAKELSMKLIRNPLKTLTTLGTSIAAVIMFTAAPSVAEDRDAIPISAPLIVYPAELAEAGITGDCEAHFDVSENGVPHNIEATCSHAGFVEEVIRAAGTMKFHPKRVNGTPTTRKGVVYPIVFELSVDDLSPEEMFAGMDKNADGQLTSDENISQNWIDAMDTDGDGGADFDEFVTALSNPDDA